jgi:hypothetical protein
MYDFTNFSHIRLSDIEEIDRNEKCHALYDNISVNGDIIYDGYIAF